MNRVIDNRLMAPGRMDVVQRVLKNEPFFQDRMGAKVKGQKNRRGIRKCYSQLTIRLVKNLAAKGLDAARMRRDEVIAQAFAFSQLRRSVAN